MGGGRGRTRPLRLMSASETLAAVPSARTPRVGQAKGMHASFKDFSKKCYTAAHADTHRMVGEALRKGVRHEEHENFRSVAGIYNSLGRCASALYTRPRPRQPEAWAGLHCCCAACLRSLGRKRAHHGLGFPELRARGPCLHPGSLGPSVALSTWLALLPDPCTCALAWAHCCCFVLCPHLSPALPPSTACSSHCGKH